MEKKGFTLVEIILVLGVISLLAVLAVPNISIFSRRLILKGEVNRLVSNLRRARQYSTKGEEKWGLVFYSEEDKYKLVRNKGNPKKEKVIKLEAGVGMERVTFPYLAEKRAVFFKELGSLVTGIGRVVLKAGPEKREVVISSNAGEINVRAN